MESKKIKKFIECYFRSYACNMACEYCFVTCQGDRVITPIDLSLCVNKIGEATTQKRLGGSCMFNICSYGETLIPEEVIDIVRSILANGHYVMVVTNGTLTERFKKFCDFPDEYRHRLFFKISFHYLELVKLKKIGVFFDNIKMIQNAGISFTVEITPDDSYIPYIPEMKEICMKKLGAYPHVTVARDERQKGYPYLSKLPHNEFVKTWSGFDSELFRFKDSIFGIKRNEFCYAGEWSFVLNLRTGFYKQCYKGKPLGNLYQDIDKPLHLYPVGCNCLEGHCYNGHAFLGFGLIPELETPDFADQRNRVCTDGRQWLGEEMEEFMRSRLNETNREYTQQQKRIANLKSVNCVGRIIDILKVRQLLKIKIFRIIMAKVIQ